MNGLMEWSECQRNHVRKVEADNERVKSIVEVAIARWDSIDTGNVDERNVSFVVEGYYEFVKELLVAYLLKNGMRSKNHQCLISYFYKMNPGFEHEAHLISQMSFFRNRLDYYGDKIPLGFYIKNRKEFERVVKLVLKLVKG